MDKLNQAKEAKKNDNVEQLMVEAASELGVGVDTHSIQEDPKSLASRLKKLIRAAK